MTSSLFLTETDPHHPRPLRGRELRAYIIQQALFFDQLIVSDSQFNNNPHLRALLWPQEPTSYPIDVPRDLFDLLYDQQLAPALRTDCDSLYELALNQRERGVKQIANDPYFGHITEYLGVPETRYALADVAELFARRVVNVFSDPDIYRRGLTRDVATEVLDFVTSRDRLHFNDLRMWMDEGVSSGRMTPRHRDLVDKLVASCYRHNVPIAMKMELDVPIRDSPDTLPFGIKWLGMRAAGRPAKRAEFELRPTFILNARFLEWIPAHILWCIKGSKRNRQPPLGSFRNVSTALATYRNGGDIDIEKLAGDVEEYLLDVERVVLETASGKDAGWFKSASLKRRVLLNFSLGSALSFIGLVAQSWEATATGILSIIHAGYGAVKELREVSSLNATRAGYIAGRAARDERLLHDIRRANPTST